MNDSKIGLSGDFTSPYVEASARPVQTAEKEKTIMHGHFIEKCQRCKRVIMQCRCIEPNKEVRWSICPNCAGLSGPMNQEVDHQPYPQEFYPMSGEKWVTAGQVGGLEKRIAELTAEKEEMLKLLYGRDLEIERLAEALGKCSQAREAALGK